MSALTVAVDNWANKLGTTNGTKVPDTQDAFDIAVHEYLISTIADTIISKRREKAKAKLQDILLHMPEQSTVDAAVREVKRREVSETVLIASGKVYQLSAQIKIGASFLNTDALRIALMKLLPVDTVTQLFTDCSMRRNPSTTFIVNESSE